MEKSMTEEESLQLINQMMRSAKRSFMRMSFFFLLWGWLLVIAGLSEYILDQIVKTEYAWVGWPITMTIGGVLASIYGAREGKKQQAKTHMDTVFHYLWSAFGIVLIATIICAVGNEINPGPFIMLLTGLPTFVSGGVIKFKPLIFGGIFFWIIGIVSFFWLHEYSSLLFCLSIVGGYLIPGYLLRKAEQKGEI